MEGDIAQPPEGQELHRRIGRRYGLLEQQLIRHTAESNTITLYAYVYISHHLTNNLKTISAVESRVQVSVYQALDDGMSCEFIYDCC